MDPINNQVFSHDAEKWIAQPENSRVNAPPLFDLSASKETRKTKDESDKKKKPGQKRSRPFGGI